MKRPKIIHPIMREIEMEARRAKFGADLLKIHQDMMARMDRFEESIAKLRGPKGDMPSQEDIVREIQAVLPYTLGQEIRDTIKSLIPEVKDGETPTEEQLTALIKKVIPKPERFSLPSGETLYSIISPYVPVIDAKAIALDVETNLDFDKIAKILLNAPKGKKLTMDHIEGLVDSIRGISHAAANSKPYIHGGGDTVRAGTNITLTRNADGTTTITAQGGSAGSIITSEVLAGIQAGNNVTLTFSGLAHTATSIVTIARNGKIMTPGSTNIDGYTLAGVISATAFGADAGDTFLVTYGY